MLDYRLTDLFPHLSALTGPAMAAYRLSDLLLIVFVFAFVPIRSLMSERRFARTPRSEMSLVRIYGVNSAVAVLVSAFLLLTWHWLGRPYSALGLDPHIDLRGWLGFGVAILLAGNLVHTAFVKTLSPEQIATLQAKLDDTRIAPKTPTEFALFPLLILTSSTMEELLFRGFLFWVITPVAGLWGAVAISTAVFGLGHIYQGWSGVLRTGGIGLGLGVGYALTHSLWWLILAHILLNLQADLLARKLKRLAAAPAQ